MPSVIGLIATTVMELLIAGLVGSQLVGGCRRPGGTSATGQKGVGGRARIPVRGSWSRHDSRASIRRSRLDCSLMVTSAFESAKKVDSSR